MRPFRDNPCRVSSKLREPRSKLLMIPQEEMRNSPGIWENVGLSRHALLRTYNRLPIILSVAHMGICENRRHRGKNTFSVVLCASGATTKLDTYQSGMTISTQNQTGTCIENTHTHTMKALRANHKTAVRPPVYVLPCGPRIPAKGSPTHHQQAEKANNFKIDFCHTFRRSMGISGTSASHIAGLHRKASTAGSPIPWLTGT